MSLAAVRVDGDIIELAVDSMETRGTLVSYKTDSKVTNRGGYVLAFCGDGEVGDIAKMLFREANWSDPLSASTIMSFLDHLYTFCDERGIPYRDEDGGDAHVQFIIVGEGKAFRVEGYEVQEITAFDSIGIAAESAMSLMSIELSPAEAVQTACKYNLYCGGPVVHITVDHNRQEITRKTVGGDEDEITYHENY